MTQYAIRGLAELAARAGDQTMMVEQLAAGAALPPDFLAKIFQKLTKAGILKSTRGRGGGFALMRPTHEITLMQIVRATGQGGENGFDGCVLGLNACDDQAACPLHDLYKPIRQRLGAYLETTTLADLAASLKTKEAWKKGAWAERFKTRLD